MQFIAVFAPRSVQIHPSLAHSGLQEAGGVTVVDLEAVDAAADVAVAVVSGTEVDDMEDLTSSSNAMRWWKVFPEAEIFIAGNGVRLRCFEFITSH